MDTDTHILSEGRDAAVWFRKADNEINNGKAAMVLDNCTWNKGKGHIARIVTEDIDLFLPLTPAAGCGL